MENKELCVATSTRDIDKKTKIIIDCLTGYPEGLNPKAIALKTRINVNTVKSLLPRIPEVKKVLRGLYKVVNRGDTPPLLPVELSEWNFHNLVLHADVSRVARRVSSSRLFSFGLVTVDFSVSNARKAVMRVSSDFPLNVSSICFVAGFFVELTGVDFGSVMVSTVEFNRDYRNLRLDGVQSVSVDGLVEQFKVYQKVRGLRVEHKTKVPMSVESIVDMLRDNPNSVDFHLKLNEQRVQLERLTLATQSTTSLLYKLLDGMNAGMKSDY